MPFTLRSTELHETYQDLSKEEAIAIANLGAICWSAVKDIPVVTGEGGDTEDVWREEGRRAGKQEMLESVRAKLGAAESLQIRLATAEETVRHLQAAAETEVARRIAERLDGFRKDYELAKMKEMTELKERLAAADAREEMITLMKDKLVTLEAQRDALQIQMLEHTAAATRSSHAIGKSGEATVLDICERSVLPHFLGARIEDMSHVGHSADFHVWVMSPVGKSVKIMIDAKKYKDTVRTKEIAKLHSDVDADDETVGGLLVSLDSQIASTKQFQIEKTKGRKAVMYVILKDMDDELRGQVMLWAVRVLSAVCSDDTAEGHQHLMDNIQLFLKEMGGSIRDAETAWRACNKAAESAKMVRDGLIQKVTDFRVGTLRETIEHVEDDTQCTATKSDGKRCMNRRISEELTCKLHKK
jgi:hypothetical protein